MWNKQNLVTQSKGDQYRCDLCGYKKWYVTLDRPGMCPRCHNTGNKTPEIIYGVWNQLKHGSVCRYCKAKLVYCPVQGHPNSKYWSLKRADGNELLVCPNGCLENGVEPAVRTYVRGNHTVNRTAIRRKK